MLNTKYTHSFTSLLLLTIALLVLLLALPSTLFANDDDDQTTSNKQKRTKVVHVQNSDNTKFSGTFWSKMRSYLPEQNKGTTNKTGVL
ncbi:MAG: hypothetical protein R8K21_07105, partial [Mariprofundales bacterium]